MIQKGAYSGILAVEIAKLNLINFRFYGHWPYFSFPSLDRYYFYLSEEKGNELKIISMRIFFIGILIILLGCNGSKKLAENSHHVETKNKRASIDSLTIKVNGINLSEDMSAFSTGNDELLILIYNLKEGPILDPLRFVATIALGQKHRIDSAIWPIQIDSIQEKVLFLLIEQDAVTPISQLDPVIRIQYKTIIQLYHEKKYPQLMKYLGEEDLLGLQIISKTQLKLPLELHFKGIHKLDKYEYRIEIK